MILAWMVYATVVALLASLAAAAVERVLRLYDLPTRGTWALAMTASAGAPLWVWLTGDPLTQVAALPPFGVSEVLANLSATVGGSAATSTADGGLSSLNAVLARGWVLTSAAGLLWLVASALRLRRSLDLTPTRSVGSVDVHLTDEEGPACWTLPGFRNRVLFPKWLRELSPEQRRLAVAHEKEHLRRGDSLLSAAGYLLVVAAPWNLPLWWQMSRLRRAVELDCDARVLAAGADCRSYGDLLLTVGGRAGGAAWTALPLSESAARLEGRIENMFASTGQHRLIRATAFGILALGAGILACEAPPPEPGSEANAARTSAQGSPERGTPAPTSYDVAPELQNPKEVQERLRAVYPDSLKRADIGGTVILWMYVNESGQVQEVRVAEGSEHPAFDSAARDVVEAMEFSPPLHNDAPTAAWVQQRILFRVS